MEFAIDRSHATGCNSSRRLVVVKPWPFSEASSTASLRHRPRGRYRRIRTRGVQPIGRGGLLRRAVVRRDRSFERGSVAANHDGRNEALLVASGSASAASYPTPRGRHTQPGLSGSQRPWAVLAAAIWAYGASESALADDRFPFMAGMPGELVEVDEEAAGHWDARQWHDRPPA